MDTTGNAIVAEPEGELLTTISGRSAREAVEALVEAARILGHDDIRRGGVVSGWAYDRNAPAIGPLSRAPAFGLFIVGHLPAMEEVFTIASAPYPLRLSRGLTTFHEPVEVGFRRRIAYALAHEETLGARGTSAPAGVVVRELPPPSWDSLYELEWRNGRWEKDKDSKVRDWTAPRSVFRNEGGQLVFYRAGPVAPEPLPPNRASRMAAITSGTCDELEALLPPTDAPLAFSAHLTTMGELNGAIGHERLHGRGRENPLVQAERKQVQMLARLSRAADARRERLSIDGRLALDALLHEELLWRERAIATPPRWSNGGGTREYMLPDELERYRDRWV